MIIFIEMYCILLIINSIVFSAVDYNSLQFKKQSEMLKCYEGEHYNFTKKARLPHCFHVALPLFFQFAWNRCETLGK